MLPIDDTAQVNVACLGLTSGMCAWHPQTFTVDSTATKKVPQFVAIMTPDGITLNIILDHNYKCHISVTHLTVAHLIHH